jgi:ubiquinone/menaquinone biosynthesis C-methylase UbiE
VSLERERGFYERQGAEALGSGAHFHCSERTITEVVIRMALENGHRFESILDIGCGANLDYDIAIGAQGKRVFGIDLTMNFLRLAPPHPGISLAQADATAIPCRDATFDAAICSETIEHIADEASVVREIARVLKPGGLLFITAPNLWNAARILKLIKSRRFTINLMEGHIREYSPRQVSRLVSPFFAVERWEPVDFGWTGKVGGPIDYLIARGTLRRLSKSIACVAHKR